jgi:uncharacterized protein YdbL (DUF1318 family)
MKIFRILLLPCLLLAAMPAWSLDLDEAKQRGLVGETAAGYLAPVMSSAEIDQLVADINDRRKKHYQQIAERNNISREAVEVRAGQVAIDKTPAGQYVNRGGGWEKK